MDSLIIEIRAGEGGEDAKDLVNLHYQIYQKYALRVGFKIEDLDFRSGLIVFRAIGKNVKKHFAKESGGIRFQRIPPTERKGRVHTSTITIVVLPEPKEFELKIEPKDLEYKTTRGSGAGGQHRNKTDSAVQLKHIPSGLMVRCEAERSQHQNKETALSILRARIQEIEQDKLIIQMAKDRKGQAGSGMRGDKIRTVRMQDDVVIDHYTDKKYSAKQYLKGWLDLLYKD